MPSVFKIIKKRYQLKKLIKYCKQTGYASVDFETNAMPITSPLFYPTILGVSFQPGSSWVLPLQHFDSPFKKDDKWKELFDMFCKEIIENKDIIKIAQNAKFEYQIFKKYGYEMKGYVFDTMLAKHLLDEDTPNGLKPMVDRWVPEFAGYSEDYEGAALPWDEKPLIGLSKYCGLDCDLTFRLMLFFEGKLIAGQFFSLFRNMHMMATRVLAESETGGMKVDRNYLDKLIIEYQGYLKDNDTKVRSIRKIRKFQDWLVQHNINKLIDEASGEINNIRDELEELEDPKKIKAAEKKISSREEKIDRYMAREMNTKKELKCLEPINFGSPNQMRDLLFHSPEGFQFGVVKYTTDKQKNETDNASTDESVLLELGEGDKTGFIESLLDYRRLSKLDSTYITGMKKHLVGDYVHANFNIHGTVTGRLSCKRPNLQNIPRDTTAKDIKRMFVPPEGYYLLQLDYSQAELRVLAAMAGEETMISWFKDGKDIHLTTALKMYKEEHRYDEIKELLDKEDGSDAFVKWKKRRKYAKTINFGIIYGQGAPKLAEALEWTVEEAKQFLKEYFELFPKIQKFIRSQHGRAHRDACVRNVFGRKRRLYGIDSDQQWEVAEAERQSVNAPIQGAASDYTLFSSILIWEEMRKGNIPIDLPQVYTVHDSLGYYVKGEHVHTVVPILEKICANPQTKEWFGFQIDDVIMKVDFELSKDSWQTLKSYDPSFDYTVTQ